MKVSVNTEEMREKSCEIRSLCSELNNNMRQIENTILSIGSEWQGDAERAYTAKLIYIRQQYSSVTKFVEDYADMLEIISLQYEEHDKELSAKINLA